MAQFLVLPPPPTPPHTDTFPPFYQFCAGFYIFPSIFKNIYLFYKRKCIHILKCSSSKQWLLSIFCVPFRNTLHTYGQIPIILFPHFFYTNETILYIHHSCLFLLTIHFERLSLSPAHEEPFFAIIVGLYPNLLTNFLLMDIYVDSNLLLIQKILK